MSVPPTAWNRRRVLAVLGVSVLVALAAAQAYELILVGQTRATGTSSGTTSTTTTEMRTITDQGSGQTSVQPDRAILSIGVITNASTAATAVQENANTVNAVISGLNAIGIGNGNIQTTYYYISPQSSCCNWPYTVIGYQVTNDIQVTVDGSGQSLGWLGAKAGQVIDTATTKGASQVNGIQFTAAPSELQQAHQAALRDAAKNAAQDAHILAAALNVTITGVVSVTPTPSYTPYPIYLGVTTVTSTPVVPPQSLTVTASVQVVFSIA